MHKILSVFWDFLQKSGINSQGNRTKNNVGHQCRSVLAVVITLRPKEKEKQRDLNLFVLKSSLQPLKTESWSNVKGQSTTAQSLNTMHHIRKKIAYNSGIINKLAIAETSMKCIGERVQNIWYYGESNNYAPKEKNRTGFAISKSHWGGRRSRRAVIGNSHTICGLARERSFGATKNQELKLRNNNWRFCFISSCKKQICSQQREECNVTGSNQLFSSFFRRFGAFLGQGRSRNSSSRSRLFMGIFSSSSAVHVAGSNYQARVQHSTPECSRCANFSSWIVSCTRMTLKRVGTIPYRKRAATEEQLP